MRFLPLLIGGPFSTLSSLELVAYLFGFSSIIIVASWLLMTLREKPKPIESNEWTAILPNSSAWSSGKMRERLPIHHIEIRKKGKATVWIGTPLVLALGIAAGYAIRDHQLITNTRTYFGVEVLSQQNDRSYTVRIPGFSQPYPWEFCHPLKMPAQVVDIKYEQRYGCKYVNGVGFVQPHKEKRYELQNGHDPAAAKPAAVAGLER